MNPRNRMLPAALALLLALLLCGCGGGTAQEQTPAEQSGEQTGEAQTPAEEPVTEEAPSAPAAQQSPVPVSIAIPGYERVYFDAGALEQSVPFCNPEANACLFHLTLRLEDGETLWESGDLLPGEQVEHLTLTAPLEPGEYSAVLKYECFTIGDRAPLNGAEISLTIIAQS